MILERIFRMKHATVSPNGWGKLDNRFFHKVQSIYLNSITVSTATRRAEDQVKIIVQATIFQIKIFIIIIIIITITIIIQR